MNQKYHCNMSNGLLRRKRQKQPCPYCKKLVWHIENHFPDYCPRKNDSGVLGETDGSISKQVLSPHRHSSCKCMGNYLSNCTHKMETGNDRGLSKRLWDTRLDPRQVFDLSKTIDNIRRRVLDTLNHDHSPQWQTINSGSFYEHMKVRRSTCNFRMQNR